MVDTTHGLAVSFDGSQNTDYPDGDKPGTVAKPTNVTASNETTTTIDYMWTYDSSGQTGFDIDRWIVGSSTVWEGRVSVGSTARFWQMLGAPSGTQIGMRIRAVSGAAFSEWQEEWTGTVSEAQEAEDAYRLLIMGGA